MTTKDRPTVALFMLARDVWDPKRILKLINDFQFDEVVLVHGAPEHDPGIDRIRATCDVPLQFLGLSCDDALFVPNLPETFMDSVVFADGRRVEDLGGFLGSPLLVDFAAARNAGWGMVSADFVLWLDSDDEIDGDVGAVVDAMARDGIDAAMVNYDYQRRGDVVTSRFPRERILRRSLGSRWGRRVHETLSPTGVPRLVPRDVLNVVHMRSSASPGHRNLKILLHWLAVDPAIADDPFFCYFLGSESQWLWPRFAIEQLTKFCRLSDDPDRRSAAHALMGRLLQEDGRLDLARAEYANALVDDLHNEEAYVRLADVECGTASWERALDFLDRGREAAARRPETSTLPQRTSEGIWLGALTRARARAGLLQWGAAFDEATLALQAPTPHAAELGRIKAQAKRALREASPAPGRALVKLKLGDVLDAPPADMPREVLLGMAIQLWKRAHAESPARGLALARNLPEDLQGDERVREMLRISGR